MGNWIWFCFVSFLPYDISYWWFTSHECVNSDCMRITSWWQLTRQLADEIRERERAELLIYVRWWWIVGNQDCQQSLIVESSTCTLQWVHIMRPAAAVSRICITRQCVCPCGSCICSMHLYPEHWSSFLCIPGSPNSLCKLSWSKVSSL